MLKTLLQNDSEQKVSLNVYYLDNMKLTINLSIEWLN